MQNDDSEYVCKNCGGKYMFRPSYVLEDGKEYIKTEDLFEMAKILRIKGLFNHSQLLRMSGEEILKEYNKFICKEI